jgi:hypothetical protein
MVRNFTLRNQKQIDEKKLEILLARWRDEMNGLKQAVVRDEPLTPTPHRPGAPRNASRPLSHSVFLWSLNQIGSPCR